MIVDRLTGQPCIECRTLALIGKGWAKGLTAASDARVARAAAAHRGVRYRRRGHRRLRTGASIEHAWSAELAYALGLMATDGCLVGDRRHMSFGSEDRALVETFRACIGLTTMIREVRTRTGGSYFRTQFGDVELYRWFESVGLTPRKSLTLGALAVPEAFLVEVTRGLLDGDGSILDFTYNGTGKARGHRYRTLITRFNSASRSHLEWLRERLRTALGVYGGLSTSLVNDRNPFFQLAYAQRESMILLARLYADRSAPCLLRKRNVWDRWRALSTAASPTLESGSAR